MDTIESLEGENSVVVAAVVNCLTLLLETYPLALAYPNNSDLKRQYISAQHCYRKSYSNLLDFSGKLQAAEIDSDNRKTKLLSVLSELRESNKAGIVKLQRTEDAALGADGLYVDTVSQYRAEAIKVVILLIGILFMSTKLYKSN